MNDRIQPTRPDLRTDDEVTRAQFALGELQQRIGAAATAGLIGGRRFRQLEVALEITASLLRTSLEDLVDQAGEKRR